NGDLDLALVDARGESYSLVGDPTRTLTIGATKVTHETTLTFQGKPSQAPPSKLVFKTTRLTTLEIPFTLKDVPLPCSSLRLLFVLCVSGLNFILVRADAEPAMNRYRHPVRFRVK